MEHKFLNRVLPLCTFLMIAVVAAVFVSCGDDDDEDPIDPGGEQLGENILKGGNFEAADADEWTVILSGQWNKVGDDTVFTHANYSFGSTTNLPTGGTGGGFNVKTEAGDEPEMGSVIYQALALEQGTYKFSGLIKHGPESATALKSFWFELVLGLPEPGFTEEIPEPTPKINGYPFNGTNQIAGFVSSNWGGDVKVARDGSIISVEDPAPFLDEATGYITIPAPATYYFVIKVGKGADGGTFGPDGITVDNFKLQKVLN